MEARHYRNLAIASLAFAVFFGAMVLIIVFTKQKAPAVSASVEACAWNNAAMKIWVVGGDHSEAARKYLDRNDPRWLGKACSPPPCIPTKQGNGTSLLSPDGLEAQTQARGVGTWGWPRPRAPPTTWSPEAPEGAGAPTKGEREGSRTPPLSTEPTRTSRGEDL